MKKRSKALIILLICLIAAAVAVVVLPLKKEIEISLNGSDNITLGYREPYVEEGASAKWKCSWVPFINGELEVKIEGTADTEVLGQNTITYTAEYKKLTGAVQRVVTVADNESPVITLKTIPDHYTLPGTPYEEEGFEATDNYDGDLTSKVTSKEEDGKVTYTVTDSSGNKAEAVREIFYDDREAPQITFEGEDRVLKGREWNGTCKAVDNVEGDMTDKVVVTGTVDTSTAGVYEITYTVSDSYGNKTELKRTVTVYEKKGSGQEKGEPVDSEKIVFLTFDDGPGVYTERLLDILDKYDVKATFFVTNQFPNYQYLIVEEAKRGHTVAVHTFSHEYSQIYANDEAYWKDYDKMNDIIEEWTGSKTDIFRFPGGSSNMVSARYSEGIMTRLTDTAIESELDYYDWNVSSGDAGETTDSGKIAKNVIEGMEEHSVSVVLMHDIHSYSVDALEQIIKYGLDNGYTFKGLYKGCYKCHHGVNN